MRYLTELTPPMLRQPRRTLLDEWDRKMIERDHKIMGKYNFQSVRLLFLSYNGRCV